MAVVVSCVGIIVHDRYDLASGEHYVSVAGAYCQLNEVVKKRPAVHRLASHAPRRNVAITTLPCSPKSAHWLRFDAGSVGNFSQYVVTIKVDLRRPCHR